MNPQRVLWELSDALPDGAILCADSGSSTNWFARDLKLRKGMKASLSGNLATMGPGMPYAIAAKFAYPERAGRRDRRRRRLPDERHERADHASSATGTRTWQGPAPLVFCVFNNRGPEPGDVGAARPRRRPAQPGDAADPRLPVRAVRRAGRLQGHPLRERRRRRRRLGRGARDTDRRSCSRPSTNREFPPLPPHITFEHGARRSTKAIAHGDEDSVGMMVESAKGKLAEFKESLRDRDATWPDRASTGSTSRRHEVPDRRAGRQGVRRDARVGLDDDRRRRGRRPAARPASAGRTARARSRR